MTRRSVGTGLLRWLVLALITGMWCAGVVLPAAAAPISPTDAAEKAWAAAGRQAELLDEQFDAAQADSSAKDVAQKVAEAAVKASASALDRARRRQTTLTASLAQAELALRPFAAAVAADQGRLAAYASGVFQGAVPSNLQLLMSADSAQNLLDQQQSVKAVAVSDLRLLARASADEKGLADRRGALQLQDQEAAAAATAAVTAHGKAMQDSVSATAARSAARQAAALAGHRRSQAQAQVVNYHALYLKLSLADQATTTAANRQATSTSAAFARLNGQVQLRTQGLVVAGLTADQSAVAAAIAQVALTRNLGERGVLIGIDTAITESTLTNVDHGDASGPSSVGVFQQMPSWGTDAQRTDPGQSAGLFFDRLVNVPGWQNLPPWMAAQAVQESEFSDGSNYQSNIDQAQSITSALLITARPTDGGSNPAQVAPNAQAQIAVDYALAQVGKKYQYSATGPDSFDSSGLTFAAWAQAGVAIPRAAFQQAGLPSVPMKQLQPGDLITTYDPVSHVVLYVGGGLVVSAADEQTGVVEVPIAQAGPHPTGHRPPTAP